jgi:DNA repair photolyase
MINEINAKSILSYNKHPSGWFGCRFVMNIYRGCEHQCIYCDSRSECYQIEDFNDIIVKINAPELLEESLKKKRKKGTIGAGAMCDAYMPIEKDYRLVRRCLEIIARYRFPVHITTKSNMILRDLDVLEQINDVYANIAFTITTPHDDLAAKVEPYASPPSERFKALGILSTMGIETCVTLMPLLPFINEDPEDVREIVKRASDAGVKYIYPSFGMTLRDRQRDYFYEKLDELFPGLSYEYRKSFKNTYGVGIRNYRKVKQAFLEECQAHGIKNEMPSYDKKLSSYQLSLFDQSNGDGS